MGGASAIGMGGALAIGEGRIVIFSLKSQANGNVDLLFLPVFQRLVKFGRNRRSSGRTNRQTTKRMFGRNRISCACSLRLLERDNAQKDFAP